MQLFQEFVGETLGQLLYVAATGLLFSFIPFREQTPGKRAFFTAAINWLFWVAISVIGSGMNGLPMAVRLLPAAIITGLLLWLMFRRNWVEDEAE